MLKNCKYFRKVYFKNSANFIEFPSKKEVLAAFKTQVKDIQKKPNLISF